ncbi:hypothetical protein IJ768_02060 [Candidatus Saccharibacteria bacterium]|nr:hypothetical protein [Candidatus Saccharibacteria bacterium]
MSRVFLFMSIISAVILSAMLFFTTPADIGPLGIFVFFMMTYLVMLGIMTILIQIFVRFVYKRKKMGWKDYADAAILAFWPVMVLVFISLGASNLVFSLIGATISVALILFLIRKV